MEEPSTLKDFFALFESDDSYPSFGLVNNVRSLILKIKHTNEFLSAVSTLLADPVSLIPIVVERANRLAERRTDIKYRNKYDIAIAGYILLVAEISVQSANQLFAEIKDKRVANLWWTNSVGGYIEDKYSSDISASTIVREVVNNNEVKVGISNPTENLGTVTKSSEIKFTE